MGGHKSRPYNDTAATFVVDLELTHDRTTTRVALFLFDLVGELFQISQALLNMLVEELVIHLAGVMHQRVSQVREQFEPVSQCTRNHFLICYDAQEFMIALWSA